MAKIWKIFHCAASRRPQKDMKFVPRETLKPGGRGILRFRIGLARWITLIVWRWGRRSRYTACQTYL